VAVVIINIHFLSISGGNGVGDFVAIHMGSGERVYGKISSIGVITVDVEEYSAVYHPNIFMASLSKWELTKLNKTTTLSRWDIEQVKHLKAPVE